MRVVGGVLVGGWVSVDGGGGVGWASARSVEKGVYMVPGVGRQGILGCLYGLIVHEFRGREAMWPLREHYRGLWLRGGR